MQHAPHAWALDRVVTTAQHDPRPCAQREDEAEAEGGSGRGRQRQGEDEAEADNPFAHSAGSRGRGMMMRGRRWEWSKLTRRRLMQGESKVKWARLKPWKEGSGQSKVTPPHPGCVASHVSPESVWPNGATYQTSHLNWCRLSPSARTLSPGPLRPTLGL